MEPHVDAIIAALATPQLGVLTVDQARSAGLTDRMRQQRLRDGRLLRAGRRTIRLPGFPPSWHQRLMAAYLAAGSVAVISHMAAAAWWGFPGIGEGAIEIIVPRRSRPRAVSGLVHQSQDLASSDTDRSQLVPVTTASRALLDVAIRLSLRQLECCVDAACRDGLTSAPYLRKRLGAWRCRGRTGVHRLGLALAGTQDGRPLGSWLEREALAIIKAAGLPPPETQREVVIDGQRYYIDLFYEQANLAIELSGHGTHATRQEQADDAERAARIAKLGHQVITFTYDQVTKQPGYVVSTLRYFLDR